MSAALHLRAEGDASLAKQILDDRDVKRSIERFEKDVKSGETRRQLLSTSVRLGPALVPELHAVIARCRERLGLDSEVEMYVYPSPHLNAACVRPEDERVLLMFSSELLDAFDGDELAFVAGHELGHHMFGHHDIPVGALLEGPYAVSPRMALQLYAWSRYAEVSADRAGMWCAGELDAVARGLFKLASGLSAGAANVVMDALLAQVDALEGFGSVTASDPVRADWFSTHPFSPLRLKAAKLFSESEYMTDGGASSAVLEAAVQDVMAIMEPGYLKDTSEQAAFMRRLLLAGAMVVAGASGDVSEEEAESIESFLGEGKVTRHLSVEALREDLPRRVDAVVGSAPLARRAQVLRDICVVARA
ncbi:MAG: M48 family metallopeptidase, partial [Planctomycetes bacterium]|nr:M48 family metallopeptidase [Planctomycetota bacterium]